MKKILVTGATGFAGRALVPALVSAGWQVRATARQFSVWPHPGVPGLDFIQADLSTERDLSALVNGVDAVVHLAARAHVMREHATDPLSEFRAANVAPTSRLAAAAARAGAKKFVLASSIKVNGEGAGERPYTESDPPGPQDAYGVSKLEAEQALHEQASLHGFSAVILRPPLMYGPGVGGNFRRLMRLVERGVPLPLGSASKLRSLLFVGNFCSGVLAALDRPGAGTRVYLLSDGEDISVGELVRRLARALGRPARVFPFPAAALRWGAAAVGLGPECRRLTESLRIDSSRARRDLDWSPPYSLDQGLALTVAA
jgi:nucleoside-diphosphate-sugar epimerase